MSKRADDSPLDPSNVLAFLQQAAEVADERDRLASALQYRGLLAKVAVAMAEHPMSAGIGDRWIGTPPPATAGPSLEPAWTHLDQVMPDPDEWEVVVVEHPVAHYTCCLTSGPRSPEQWPLGESPPAIWTGLVRRFRKP